MKKIFLVLAVALYLFSGCSGGSGADIAPADAARTILDNVTFRDTMVETPEAVVKEWYELDENVESFAVYKSGSGATAEEVAVIRTSDVKTARAAVEKRVENLKYMFEDYVPAEMTKLNDPVIEAKNGVVILVLADDSSQAQKAVDGLFK